MKTILVIPFSRALSHLSRMLMIAKELKGRGHTVIFATDNDSKNNHFIKASGFERTHLFEPDGKTLFDNIRKGKLKFISHDVIEFMIDKDCQLFRKIKPDLILSDGRFTAAISAQRCKIKHAAVTNASSSEYRSIPYIPFFSDIRYQKLENKSPHLFRILKTLNLFMEKRLFDKIMHSFTSLSKKYAVSHRVTATNCLTGVDLTLLADIPEYFPTTNLPENYRYIGPLIWKNHNLTSPSHRLVKPGPGKKFVYITMGTTGEVRFFPVVYDLFKQTDMYAVITTGDQISDLTSDTDHILISSYLDADQVIKAADVTICHGGNGTIYQSLSHGKPIIGIPTLQDQNFNMRRVVTLGLGKKIPIDLFFRQPEILIETIQAVTCEPLYYHYAEKMKKRLQTFNAETTASDLIEQLIET